MSDSAQHGPSQGHLLVLGGLALSTGVISALQSRVNGSLAITVGQPLQAALWSFASGWALVSVAAAVRPAVRRGLASVLHAYRSGGLRWWQLLGGLLGGAYVGTQSYAVPVAGVALFSIGALGGQTVNALLVDRLGLGPAGVKPVSRLRVAAAGLALVGIAVAVGDRVGGTGTVVVVAVLAAFVTGAGLSVQSAINGRVRQHGRDALAATWINFGLGTALLSALVLIRLVTGSMSWSWPGQLPAWMLWGGLLGVANIALGTVLVHRLGVLVLMLLGLCGQLFGALVLDLLSPSTRGFVSSHLIAGVVVTFVAAAAAGIAARRDRSTPPSDGRMNR